MVRKARISEVVDLIEDGMTLMIGGFIGNGVPDKIISSILDSKITGLTMIANDTGILGDPVSQLIVDCRVCKVIASHIGTNPETGKRMNNGDLEVELVPQGTLVERIRAAGAGLGGILTPTGVGTVVEAGKEKVEVAGKEYLLEHPLFADIAIIKANKSDMAGNLAYRRSARNFNPIMAMAAKIVIAQVDEVIEEGYIDPDHVITPGIFVDFVVEIPVKRVRQIG